MDPVRMRTGHAPEDWTDHGPSSPPLLDRGYAGEMVTGERGVGHSPDANRLSSRRYRARHPERLNEYQRAYRARLRAEAAAMRSAA